LYGFTTGVLGILVQAFLVFRYWCLYVLHYPSPSISLHSSFNYGEFQYSKNTYRSFPVFRHNHLGVQIIVSARHLKSTVPPVQFGSLFASDTMTVLTLHTLNTSLADRPMFKIPVACVPYRKFPSSGIHSSMTTAYFVCF
jgi:hypothetical protein